VSNSVLYCSFSSFSTYTLSAETLSLWEEWAHCNPLEISRLQKLVSLVEAIAFIADPKEQRFYLEKALS
jgi:hypothetical protein